MLHHRFNFLFFLSFPLPPPPLLFKYRLLLIYPFSLFFPFSREFVKKLFTITMFRRCSTRLVSPFVQFVIESKGTLTGIPAASRGVALGKQYHALTAKAKAALVARAKATPLVRKPKAPKQPRAPSAYALFVKKNWNTVADGTAPQKLKAIAKLWKKK